MSYHKQELDVFGISIVVGMILGLLFGFLFTAGVQTKNFRKEAIDNKKAVFSSSEDGSPEFKWLENE